MSVEPLATDIYDLLCKQGSPKFTKSLERVKAACDHIVAAKGPLTYSQVGAVATKLFGGPKAQSIHNNVDHKQYIDARQREYRQQPLSGSATGKKESRATEYPSSGLDFKTRRYIDDLRQRNDMLEAAMREFRIQVARATKENPVDVSQLLNTGPDTDGAMAVPQLPAPSVLSESAKAGLRTLLHELPKLVKEVEDFQGKALRLRSGDWLVPPDQYAALLYLINAP